MIGQHRQKLLRYPLWIPRGLDEAKAKGPWPEWEEKLLQELIAKPTDDCFRPALEYCDQVLRGPWPSLEQILADPPPLWSRAGDQHLLPIYAYISHIGRSPSLERVVLDKGLGTVAFLYAMFGMQAPWPEAEEIILNGDTQATAALIPPDIVGDASHDGSECYQIVQYAKLLIRGRWHAFDNRLQSGSCNALTVALYDLEVVQEPRPEVLSFLLRQPEDDSVRSALICHLVSRCEMGFSENEEQIRRDIENKISCSPSHLAFYAIRILKSRLPDALHNFMVMESFKDTGNKHIKGYMAHFGISAS